MTTIKYYLKEKCEHYMERDEITKDCALCDNKGFIRGADVTGLVNHFIDYDCKGWKDKSFDDLIEVVEDD